jgi:hypothetical protein
MALSDDDRARIYEEEKVRAEARERAEKDIKKKQGPGFFQGCLALVVIVPVGLFALGVVATAINGGPSHSTRTTGASRGNSTSALDRIVSPPITMAKFNSLKTGMSYAQVVKILGEEGKEQSRSDIGGMTTVMYMWQNPTGGNMNAMFQRGALNMKAQFGLN